MLFRSPVHARSDDLLQKFDLEKVHHCFQDLEVDHGNAYEDYGICYETESE